MTNKYRRARKKRKKWWPYLLSFFLLVVLGSGIGVYLAKPSLFSGLQFWKAKKTAVTTPSSSKKKEEKSDLPAVSTKDWQLILVNRDNVKPELNPQLTDVDAIKVDSRIVEPTRQFLEAARKIAPEETLISGYRSVAEQTELYNERVAQLEASGLSHEEA